MNHPPLLTPRTLQELLDALRGAAADGARLRIGGAGGVERFEPGRGTAARRLCLRLFDTVEIVERDFTARVGAGVDVTHLDARLKRRGLVWPLRRLEAPGSVGGLIACGRASAIHADDAPARRWVLGAHVCDGSGAALTVGGATVKNSVGYGLTHALWGSRGRLGVITQATLRLRRRRDGDDAPVPVLDRRALAEAAALVRCDDLAPGTAAQALAQLTLATHAAASSDGSRAAALYASRGAAETNAAALRAHGLPARVEPPHADAPPSPALHAARTALDPAGIFV